MRLEDLMISAVFFTLSVLAVWAYRHNLARAFPAPAGLVRRARQSGVLGFAAILFFTFLNPHAYRDGLVFLALVAGLAVGFTVFWVREFLFLMALRDDDLPGRFDKPIWAALLIALPPLGLFLFRSHRLAHWPEPEPKPRVPPVTRELA